MSSRKHPTMKSAATPQGEPGKSATGREVVRRVTASVIKFEIDKPRVVRIDDAMRISTRKGGDGDKGGKTMGPATIMTATDIETGEQGVIVVNKVLAGNLAEQYPDDSYVGRTFEIVKHPKKKGAKFEYSPFDITEVKA